MKRDRDVQPCRGCGAEIRVIRTASTYGKVVVDAEPVWIRLQYGGILYIQPDGEIVFGFPAGDADDDPDSNLIEAYAPHRGHCPTGGRKPRERRERRRRNGR